MTAAAVVPVVVAGNRTIHAGRQIGTYGSGNARYGKLCSGAGREPSRSDAGRGRGHHVQAVSREAGGGCVMALVADRGWGDWWLTATDLAPTHVTQAQADLLLGGIDGVEVLEAGSCEVRFGDAFGGLLCEMADGRWVEVSEDGRTQDVTKVVMG